MPAPCVIGWWESDLRLAGGDRREGRRLLGPGEDAAQAVAELAAEAGPRPHRAVRIIYQPDGLETHELGGGEMGRRALQRRINRVFPAFAGATTVWAAEPAPRGRDSGGPSTRLHVDRSGRLPAAAAVLARRGWRVEGAWSLAGLLETAAGPARRGAIHLLATAERSLLTSLGPEGGRWVKLHDGPDFIDATLASLRSALARFDEGDPPGGMAVIEDGPGAAALRAAAGWLGPAGASWTELLRQADRLAPADPGNFLPVPPGRGRPLLRAGLAAAGSVALLAAAASLHSAHLRREEARRHAATELAERRRREARAAAELAAQRAAAREAEALERAACAPQQADQFLRALARALPPAAVLHRLMLEGGTFALGGTTVGGGSAAAADWRRFLAEFGAAQSPWHLEGPADLSGTDFALRGRWRPPQDPPRPASLAAACAGFPSAASFFPRWQEWSRSWAIQARPPEEFPGFEIRHYTLAARRPELAAWPQIVDLVAALGRQPGVTLERMALVAGPGEAFSQAEIEVAVRLRP